MPSRYRFSVEEDDKIIAFVKNNQSLSIGKVHPQDAERNQLWDTLATEMNVDAYAIKNRWHSMRCYFRQVMAGEGRRISSVILKRQKSLMFLLKNRDSKKTNLPKRSLLRYLYAPSDTADSSNSSDSSDAQASTDNGEDSDSNHSEVESNGGEDEGGATASANVEPPMISPESTSTTKIIAMIDLTEEECGSPKRQPGNPSEILEETETEPAEPPKDDLAVFFDAIASTMRKFPPVAIARTKLEIARIVGEEEILNAM